MKTKSRLALAIAALTLAGSPVYASDIDDAALTTKVKAALLTDSNVSSLAINVDTLRGQVQLSGFVKSQEQARRAVDLAQRVDGVKDVINKMTVQP